jgi:hypothetical protein
MAASKDGKLVLIALVLQLDMMDIIRASSGKPSFAQPHIHCCFGSLLVGLAENRQSLTLIDLLLVELCFNKRAYVLTGPLQTQTSKKMCWIHSKYSSPW